MPTLLQDDVASVVLIVSTARFKSFSVKSACGNDKSGDLIASCIQSTVITEAVM